MWFEERSEANWMRNCATTSRNWFGILLRQAWTNKRAAGPGWSSVESSRSRRSAGTFADAGSKIWERSPLRRANAAPQSRFPGGVGALAGARHRREHGDFQPDQCSDVAVAAGAGTRTPGADHPADARRQTGSDVLSAVRYFRDNLKSISGAAVELASSSADHVGRRGGDGQRGTGLRRPLFTPGLGTSGRKAAGPGGRRDCARIAGGSDQLPVLAAALRPRSGCDRKNVHLQDKVFTIVGVTPPRYQGTRPGRDPDITLPL